MSLLNILIKSLRELGPRVLIYYGLYKLGIYSRYYRLLTPTSNNGKHNNDQPIHFRPLLQLPKAGNLLQILGEPGVSQLLDEANQIVEGKVRLFGSELVPLKLDFPFNLKHWSEYEMRGFAPTAEDTALIPTFCGRD